jgi:hypothetical protein
MQILDQNLQQFTTYEEFWQLQEPAVKPHKQRAYELGLIMAEVPVSPVLTPLKETLQRLDTMYNLKELEAEGIDVRAMLSYMTEQQVIEELEEAGIEQAILPAESEALMASQDYRALAEIPINRKNYFFIRQLEDGVDTSAFNTVDFFRLHHFEFDKYRYFTDKVAERIADLAMTFSCISNQIGKNNTWRRYASLVNSTYRDRALRLAAIFRATQDSEQKYELYCKIQELNRQIRRVKRIWHKYAYMP